MARQMSYTDQYGDVYASSYWRVVQVSSCKEEQSGRFVFYGFEDASHKGKRVIGQKSYDLTADEWQTYLSSTALDPLNNNNEAQSYVFALAKLDVDSGQKDGNGNPVMVSFFNNSIEV